MIIKSLNKLEVTSDVVIKLTNIYKNVGKQDLYEIEIQQDIKLKTFFTAEKNTIYVAKLLGLNITDARLEHIVKNRKEKLKNRTEETVMNLFKMFLQLYNDDKQFPIHNTSIQNLVKSTYGVQFGSDYNEITKTTVTVNKKIENYDNINEADEILEVIRENNRKQEYEHLLLSIIAFVDYYNTDLFKSQHKITSLILLYILFLQQNLKVFKYVSMFEYIYNNFEGLNDAIIEMSLYKQEGIVKPLAMQRYLLNMVDNMYQEFETYVKERKFDKTLNKTQNIVHTIYKLPEMFQKSDIKRLLPGISEVTINKTLQVLHEREIIKPIGKGRGASWLRLHSNENEIDFEAISKIQISSLKKHK